MVSLFLVYEAIYRTTPSFATDSIPKLGMAWVHQTESGRWERRLGMAVKYKLLRNMVKAERFVIMMNPTVAVLIKLFDFYFYFNE